MDFRPAHKFLILIGLCMFIFIGDLSLKNGLALNLSKIVFSSMRDGNYEIYVMDADGKNQTRLTRNLETPGNPSWSPDGQRIVFSVFIDRNFEICVMDSDGKNLDRLTFNLVTDLAPALSPDGSKIAFERFEEKFRHSKIHLMTSDGKNLKHLSHPNHNDSHPDWFDPRAWAVSPTGNQITIWGRLRKFAPI